MPFVGSILMMCIYTFWDYFRNAWLRDAGLRLDHLRLSPSLVNRLIDAGVDREIGDGHLPPTTPPTWVNLG